MASLNLGEALIVSLLGFSIVFFVLIVLMGMIRALRFIMDKLDNPQNTQNIEEAEPAAHEPVSETRADEVKLCNVDEKTAAMIMAIVAHETNLPLNELRFISIRALKN